MVHLLEHRTASSLICFIEGLHFANQKNRKLEIFSRKLGVFDRKSVGNHSHFTIFLYRHIRGMKRKFK